jgi:hypothetical protein
MEYLTKAQYENADARDYSLFCYRTYSASCGISVVTQITRRIESELNREFTILEEINYVD